MPAAFYEFNIEQGSDFVTSFKVTKPGGGLFKFIPSVSQTFWSGTTLNIDVPEEIKLAKLTNENAFGWITTATAGQTFLIVRSKVKTNQGVMQMYGERTYSVTSTKTVSVDSFTAAPKKLIQFDLIQDNTEYNVTMKIPSGNTLNNNCTGPSPSGTSCYNGKYLYDIEFEYQIGAAGSTPTPFVIRLLQGRMTFNPNITT